jgi:hypothetical protein
MEYLKDKINELESVGIYYLFYYVASSSKPLKNVNSEREIGGPGKDLLSE